MHEYLMLRPGKNIEEAIQWAKTRAEEYLRDHRQAEQILKALNPISSEWELFTRYDCYSSVTEELYDYIISVTSSRDYAQTKATYYRTLYEQLRDNQLTKALEPMAASNGVAAD